MRRHPLLVAILAVGLACLLVAGLGVGLRTLTPSASSALPVPSRSTSAERAERSWPAPAAIDWHACSAAALAHAECATVAVPRDWDSPGDGRLVHLAISRVRHTEQPYQGPILVNPGGPGVSGL